MVSEWAEVWKTEDFANAYRNWMLESMHAERYSILFDILHDTEFTWSERVPRDADREADGRYLRLRFVNGSDSDIMEDWLEVMDVTWPASFLEFLIALAYSIDDKIMYDPERPDQASLWFWEMLDNVGLARYDDVTMFHEGMLAWAIVTETVDRILQRRYEYDGGGGLFPLRSPKMDQRNVEIWYQANAYMIENYIG